MRRNRAGRIVMKIAIGILALSLIGFVTMSLWNWLMPAILGLHRITWVQALGLLVLCKILFGSFHKRRGPGPRWGRGMEERWAKMTPEERERLRAGMRGRWGCGFGRDQQPAAEQKPAA